MSNLTNTDQLLINMINDLKALHSSGSFQLAYDLLIDNAYDYQIKSDDNTIKVIESLRLDSKPLDNSNYRLYYSIVNYQAQKGSRAIHSLQKLLTAIYHEINDTVVLSPIEKIKVLELKNVVLINELNKFKDLRSVEVPKEMLSDIATALIPTNLNNCYDLDIFSSMKQQQKETDLIVTRTYKFTMFAAGILEEGLKLPYGSVIYAKGGDGTTRFVRLLQGAGDLIKASKELWSKKRISLAVYSLNSDVLRMNVDDEASRIIQEGIKQTLTTLISQAKTKKNTQVITSVLGALLRAGYPLTESLDRMYNLLDTEKTITISEELAKRAVVLMTDGRVNTWHKMMLCPDYSKDELQSEIMTLVGVGKGNIDKRCKAIKYHGLFKVKCPECNHE